MDIGELIGFGACGAFIIVPIIIWLAIAIYMYKDAKDRGESGAVWFIVGFICGIIGLIIWLIKRPPKSEGMG